MPNEKPTLDLAQLDIIRGLLERQAAKTDAIEAKVDASRAEGDRRGNEQAAYNKRFEADLGAVRKEVHNLSHRVTIVESDVSDIKERHAETTRTQSEANLEAEAALGGAIAHVKTLDQKYDEIRQNDEKQNRVDEAICRELGLDYDEVAAPRTPTDPPSVRPSKKKTALVAMAQQHKTSIGLTSIVLVLEIVLEIVRHMHW